MLRVIGVEWPPLTLGC